MASPYDPFKQEPKNQQQHKKKGPNFLLMLPLIYAPVLPLIRITLRHKPVLRDRLFTVVLAGAFGHGAYLVSDLYDVESK
ncbi:putative C4-dicarboxylate sensor kinase [Bienertia sinuspersici]